MANANEDMTHCCMCGDLCCPHKYCAKVDHECLIQKDDKYKDIPPLHCNSMNLFYIDKSEGYTKKHYVDLSLCIICHGKLRNKTLEQMPKKIQQQILIKWI